MPSGQSWTPVVQHQHICPTSRIRGRKIVPYGGATNPADDILVHLGIPLTTSRSLWMISGESPAHPELHVRDVEHSLTDRFYINFSHTQQISRRSYGAVLVIMNLSANK
jgi:hypothetical protein